MKGDSRGDEGEDVEEAPAALSFLSAGYPSRDTSGCSGILTVAIKGRKLTS